MSSVSCTVVNTLNVSWRCAFVRNNTDCQNDDSLLDYMDFVYCDFQHHTYVPLIICLLWLIILFVALGLTADDYFCPSLEVLAEVLKLPDNVAGVTFLAFGNGAPDIFSSIAGVQQMRPELVISALFGGGIFITCVVVGIIVLIHPFEMAQRPFLRDVIFYLAAVFWTFYLFHKGTIAFYHSIGFILLYLVYIATVLIGHVIYRKYLKPSNAAESSQAQVPKLMVPGPGTVNETSTEINYLADDSLIPWGAPPFARRHSTVVAASIASETTPLLTVSPTTVVSPSSGCVTRFLHQLSPIDVAVWRQSPWWRRTLLLLKSPVVLVLNLTVPVINRGKKLDNWNRCLAVVHCLTVPIFFIFAIGYGEMHVLRFYPLWSIALMAGLVLGATVWLGSYDDRPPAYHAVFAFVGFATSVVWIYLLAREIVSVLKAVGVVFHLSDAILGLTVLAWGNCLGDLIADVAIAKQGFPRMGMSACFGGPLFNLLLGIGIPFTIETLKRPNRTLQVAYESATTVLSCFLGASLISSLVMVPLMRFHLKRFYGVYLLLMYTSFLTLSFLNEFKIL